MTTHYEKIQALGNRMASNLETMGVSASFGDGGLTLADKILEIQHFTDGLLLYADKSIIQIDDTVNVYALLLDERKAVSGETILFNGLETTQTLVANTETTVGNQYRFTNLPSSSSDWGDGKVYLNEEQTAYLHHNGDNIMLFANNRGYPISNNISIENGIITCYDSQTSSKYTFDISSTNTNKITSTISDVTITETMQGTTGSDGVATVSYTGKGTGLLNIKAGTIDGIIQSETYSITDATFYDEAILGHKNTNWNANRLVVSETDNTGTLLYSENGQGHYWANNHNGITGSFVCEFDLISYSDTNTVSFRISGTNTHYIQFKNRNIAPNSHIKITYDGSSCNFQINDGEPINLFNASYPSIELALRLYGAEDTLKYANFVIYPI